MNSPQLRTACGSPAEAVGRRLSRPPRRAGVCASHRAARAAVRGPSAELGSDIGEVRVGQLVLLPLGCGTWSSHDVAEAQLRPLPDQADPLEL